MTVVLDRGPDDVGVQDQEDVAELGGTEEGGVCFSKEHEGDSDVGFEALDAPHREGLTLLGGPDRQRLDHDGDGGARVIGRGRSW